MAVLCINNLRLHYLGHAAHAPCFTLRGPPPRRFAHMAILHQFFGVQRGLARKALQAQCVFLTATDLHRMTACDRTAQYAITMSWVRMHQSYVPRQRCIFDAVYKKLSAAVASWEAGEREILMGLFVWDSPSKSKEIDGLQVISNGIIS